MCLDQHVSRLCLRSSQATVLTVCGDDCTSETQDIETTPEKEKSEDGLPLVVERQRETGDVEASDIHLDVTLFGTTGGCRLYSQALRQNLCFICLDKITAL